MMMIDASSTFKHELAKGFVQAILKRAGYRVIPSGMEHVVREVTPLTASEYAKLDPPSVVRNLPDFIVLDAGSSRCSLVDANYRAKPHDGFKRKLETKIAILGELTLILFNGGTKSSASPLDLSGVVRCCRVRGSARGAVVEIQGALPGSIQSTPLKGLSFGAMWDGMLPLKATFGRVDDVEPALEAAVETAARAFAA